MILKGCICVAGEAIGCFVCTSINGSEPLCEDTFNNVGDFYQPECQAGRPGRNGTFPGTQCIKLKAELGELMGCIVSENERVLDALVEGIVNEKEIYLMSKMTGSSVGVGCH